MVMNRRIEYGSVIIRRAGTLWVLEGQNLEGGTFVWGPRRGSEATERGEGVGGGIPPPPPSHVRDFFINESLKVAFVEHLKTIF